MKTWTTVLLCALASLSLTWRPEPGLLTDDFGVLTEEDLTLTRNEVEPRCWEFDEHCPTSYWQCLFIENYSAHCHFEDTWDDGTPFYSPILQVKSLDHSYEFYTRRPWELENCKATLEKWSRILRSQQYTCFAAQVHTVEAGKDSSIWQVERIKTSLGKWSYFCNPTWQECPSQVQ